MEPLISPLPVGSSDDGATMAEYGLLIALVVLVALVGATVFAVATDDLWDRNCDQVVMHASQGTCN